MNSPVLQPGPRLFDFDNSYSRDLEGFYVGWNPTPVPAPRLVILNRALAEELRVDPHILEQPAGVDALAGNLVPAGASPLAQAYAGHQFGQFSPQLGDGRALLLGEVIDRNGERRDIAFKGSGRTPFSRRGDGKCALGPALREYLVGEAMAALGVPTTRTLAVVATGETVRRDRPLPGAVLTRVAASHLRIGTFEFFAAHRGPEAVKQLADYAIARHYPDLAGGERPYVAFLDAVARRQAALVARWLGIGFIHGVMNTDNMSISGETIDYGPCAFMETYHPLTVFSSIDTGGRYAYGQQGKIAQWNLARLAEALLPLLDPDEERAVTLATEILEAFPAWLDAQWLKVFGDKLGLPPTALTDADHGLVADFLALLAAGRVDFTLAFRALHDEAAGTVGALANLLGDAQKAAVWLKRWRERVGDPGPQTLATMKRANPAYIPRNHRVEEALDAAVDREDMAPFERLLTVLLEPFDARPEDEAYSRPAAPEVTAAYQTFCGT
jgi:uncharacterized protein YdiU (UPF0061 family)